MEEVSRLESRKSRILSCVDIRNERGLEIGPLDRPVVTKEDGCVLYMDQVDTRALKEKYARNTDAGLVSSENLVEVDLVADGRPLVEILGDLGPVDYVVASHVIEHIPNPVGWLIDIATVLDRGGRISLVIPDRRFTFDHFRDDSNTAALIEAHLAERRHPSPAQIYDYFSNVADIDPATVWAGLSFDRRGIAGHVPDRALQLAAGELAHDVHCFVFAPYSFVNLLRELIGLDLLPFEVESFESTRPGSIEFFTTLRKSDASGAERVATVPILDPILDGEIPSSHSPTMQEIVAGVPTKCLLSTLASRILPILAALPRRLFHIVGRKQ